MVMRRVTAVGSDGSGGGDPGGAVSGVDEDVEHVLTLSHSGGGVGADRGEFFGAAQGRHAAGDLDPQFRHPDGLLSGVVIDTDGGVVGEPLVVLPPVDHPGEQGVVLGCQLRGPPRGGVLA